MAYAMAASAAETADYEFSRIIEEDRYEEVRERPGNPAIVQGNISAGLLVQTGMGRYSSGSSEPLVIGAGKYALPEGGRIRFGNSVRIYGFEGVGGVLRTAISAGGKGLVLSVAGRPEDEAMSCKVEGAGMSPIAFTVPQKSLPVDFAFTISDRGDFTWRTTGLADSSDASHTGRSSIFEGFWVSGYGYPPIDVNTVFICGKDGAMGGVTIDNRIIGDSAPAAKLDVPAKISPLAEFDPVKAGWRLVFSDEFDGTSVDWTKWRYLPKAGNPDKDDICRLDGRGTLELKCDYGPDGTNLVTGSMRSRQEFVYGYFEARVKLTRQNGWWAAVWLYGWLNSDPFVDGVEIDIFEDYYTRKKDGQGRNRRLLDHNLHMYLGSQLKSWNFTDEYEGSLDDWITVGCRRTPFETSYYLNGKLIRSAANHCDWPSVTFDAFNHSAATVPLHVIVSGQVMGPSWPWFDKKDAKFPELFKVDYVRCYEMPRDAATLPQVSWKGREGDVEHISFFSHGDRFRFEVEAKGAEKTASPISAVYLFDAGCLVGYRTRPPYVFDVEMTEEWYSKTRYMKPGRQKVVPDFRKAPHSFMAFAQDESGAVSHTAPVRMHPKFYNPATRPYGGEPQKVPGRIVPWRYDEGGQGVAYSDTTKGNSCAKYAVRLDEDVDCTEGELANIMPGEWVNYTVDVEKDGLYSMEMAYGTGIPGRHRVHVLVDGEEVGTFNAAYSEARPTWSAGRKAKMEAVPLKKGRHVLTLYFQGRMNMGHISIK